MNGTIDDEVFQQEEVLALTAHSSPGVSDASPRQADEIDDVARRVSETYPGNKPIVSSSGKSVVRRRGGALRTVRVLLHKVATAGIAVVAVLIVLVTWDHYNDGPWTRDGRVRVQVASVAPEISGQIIQLRIVDNQVVHKGDVLYVIDPFDFDVALRTNKAVLQQRMADLNVKDLQSERRRRLSDLASSTEEKQIYEGNALQAKAAEAASRLSAKNAIRRQSMLMWWRSAVNLSFFRCLATCRTHSSACATRSRPCVRSVLCWRAFPLAPALGSTGSAAVGTALFVGFTATMAVSDFSRPCIIGYGSSPSRCGPTAVAERSSARSPGSRARSVCTCQGL